MKLAATKVFVGPSIYSQHPVVYCVLEGHGQDEGQYPDATLLGRLVSTLPGLQQHASLCAGAELLNTAGDEEVIPLGHLFEHVCIELQNLSGAGLACVRHGSAGQVGADGAAVPYVEPEVGVEAVRLASDLMVRLASEHPGSSGADDQDPEFEERLRKFVEFATATMLPVQDRAMVRTARALDIPARRLVGRTIVLGEGRYQQRLSATKTSLTNVVSNDLAANKDYSRRVLMDVGLPVPRYERIYTRRGAGEAARRIGFPVVVKPNNGSMGSGVSVGMKNQREVAAAYNRARELSRSILVEEVVEGADYRMLVINGRLCAASRRVPAHVVGDGVHTIEALVDLVNSDPRRGTGPTSSWTRIELDEQADRLITGLGYTRQSVPPEGEVVFLRRNANTSDGGTAVDVTDEVHPHNRDIAVRAARAIGLDVAGVDFLTTDISSSMWKNGGRICEINSRPGLRKHLWPASGKPRDVLTPIIDMLFPPERPARIPSVAIIGTGNTGTVARMLQHVLAAAGHHVGLATMGRVYSGGRRTVRTRLKPTVAARSIFLDPDADVAVLEMSPDDIVRHGLGCDSFDVVAIVNGDASAVAGRGVVNREQRAALELVARNARSVVYAGEFDGSPARAEGGHAAARFSRVVTETRRRRTADAGTASADLVVVEGESIAIYEGGQVVVQIPLAESLKRLPGSDPDQIVQCAVFASICAYGIGAKPGDIYRSLGSFSPPARRSQSGKRRASDGARDSTRRADKS